MALAVACAAVGLAGAASGATPVPPVVWLELDVVEFCASRICSGLVIVGLDATDSVLAAAVIAMSVCRSCSSIATEPLLPRPSIVWKRLLAPVPCGFITLAAPQTTTTSSRAKAAAGSAIPPRRSRPRFFFRALRAPGAPVRPVPSARAVAPVRTTDSARVAASVRMLPWPESVPAEPAPGVRVSPLDACGRSASIADRCRDNAVPSVHVVPIARPSTAADQRFKKETSVARDFVKKERPGSLPFRDTANRRITRTVTAIGEVRDDRLHERRTGAGRRSLHPR